MRKLIATALLAFVALFAGAAAQSHPTAEIATSTLADDVPSESIPEPITGDPVQPLPGSETAQKNPSEPYDIGPPEHAWKPSQLSAEEKAAVERGRAAGAARAGMHQALTLAAKEQSKRARAEAAQHQLGLDRLDAIGVVP